MIQVFEFICGAMQTSKNEKRFQNIKKEIYIQSQKR